MNDAVRKHIELSANIAIIIVAALICLVVIRTQFFSHSGGIATTQMAPTKGTPITLKGEDWAANGQSLILVLSTKCQFCLVGAPVYNRIVKAIRAKGKTKVIAIFPEDTMTAAKYVDRLGLATDAVVSLPPYAVGARGTPTVILVDGHGRVIDSWVGPLTPIEEHAIVAQVNGS